MEMIPSSAVASEIPSTSSNTQELEVVWTWKRDSMQGSSASINHYVRLSILDVIRSQLLEMGDEWYEALLNSELGHFLLMSSDSYFSTSAIHAMLVREVTRTGGDPNVFWFRVGPRTVRFSQYEYALVTGLKFGDCDFDPNDCPSPPADGVYYTAIRPIGERMTVHDLLYHFSQGVFRQRPEDVLKVARVLLIYYIIFDFDDRQTVIERWIWTIVEDPEQFNIFPWGNYTFQILGHYLRTAPTSLAGRRCTYHLYGCVMAFAIWVCEAVPSLGYKCGVKLDTHQRQVPRCVRWLLKKTNVSFVGFFDDEIECYETLAPTTEEQGAIYWRDVGIDIRGALPQFVPRLARGDRVFGQRRRRNESSTADVGVVDRPDGSDTELPPRKRRHTLPASVGPESHLWDLIHECPYTEGCTGATPLTRSSARENADSDPGLSHGKPVMFENCATSVGPELDGLKNEVAGLKNEVAGIKTEMAGLKNDIGGLRTEMTGIRQFFGKLCKYMERNFPTSAATEF